MAFRSDNWSVARLASSGHIPRPMKILIGFERLLTRKGIFLFKFMLVYSTVAWAGFCLLDVSLSLGRTSSQEYLYDIYGTGLQSYLWGLDSLVW